MCVYVPFFPQEEEPTLVPSKSSKPPAAASSASGPRAARLGSKILVYGSQDNSSAQGPSAALSLLPALASIPFHRLCLHTILLRLKGVSVHMLCALCSSAHNDCSRKHGEWLYAWLCAFVCCMECIHCVLLINHFLITRATCFTVGTNMSFFLHQGL